VKTSLALAASLVAFSAGSLAAAQDASAPASVVQPTPSASAASAPSAAPAAPVDAASPAAASKPRERLGPVEIETKHARFRIGGVAQLTSEMQVDDQGEVTGFADFRRLRIDTRVSFFDDDLSLRTHISTMPRDPELLDLHVDARLHELVKLRAGVAKTPFTSYRQQSINDHVLVDWPITSRWFGGERQLGFTAEGKPGDARYAVGVYGGDASRPQNQRFSTAYGDFAPSRTSFRTATPFDVPHPELMARGGYQLGPVELTGNVAWDARPVHGIDATARFALEAHLDTERVDLWGIGYAALADDLAGETGEGLYGAMAEAAFRVHDRVELALRYAAVALPERLRVDARATIDARIAEAPEDEQEELAEKYASVGRVKALQEATAGFAVYFFGHDLKWHNDVSWLHETREGDAKDAFRLRTELQLAF
jgi:hypothetical protein